MDTIAKVTLKIEGQPKFDVLIEMESASYKETQKITSILESQGYQDFEVVDFMFLKVERIIFQPNSTIVKYIA